MITVCRTRAIRANYIWVPFSMFIIPEKPTASQTRQVSSFLNKNIPLSVGLYKHTGRRRISVPYREITISQRI
jgi:hypothetical protein